MEKIHASLILFSIVAALALGLLLTGALAQQDSAVIAAIAEQERAKAAKMQAEAETAAARAIEARLDAQAMAAALPAIADGKRWSAWGLGAAMAVLLVGLALDAVLWLGLRAFVVYPNDQGHWPIVLGPHGGTLPGLNDVPLQIATQAQASAAMIGVAGASKQPVADVAERVSRAAQALPAPTFAAASASDGDADGVRLVYVNDPQRGKAGRKLSDIEELIRRGWEVGLKREMWMGKRFTKTGNRISRPYYDELMAMLERAGLVENANGWRPLVTVEDALRAFGL